ncbi:MAG TPA: hypothetical protein VGS08_00890 [Candidatus Saccharimonadales bacterium]|nr:hypothetical protein [Candidatus Saccharimonadales bacterium]
MKHIAMSDIEQHNPNPDNAERGIVSLLVTMVLMVVISLIVLGFAQTARRNQTTQLDQQLSVAALYAAESGINDALQVIQTNISSVPLADFTEPNCMLQSGNQPLPGQPSPDVWDGKLPPFTLADGASYSCLTVNAEPPIIRYGDVGLHSIVVPINAASGAISQLTLQWGGEPPSSNTTCPNANPSLDKQFSSNWQCNYGVLRVDLVPTTLSQNATQLEENTMTFFVVPDTTATASSLAFQPASSGNTNDAFGLNCNVPQGSPPTPTCKITITGLSSQGNKYYMRISSQEIDAHNLQITAQDSGGSNLKLYGAEVVVDATGKAQNVLRRIAVYAPLTTQNGLPDFALESTNPICKQFAVLNGYYGVGPEGCSP